MPRMLKNYWSLRRKKITEVWNLLFYTTRLVFCTTRLGPSSGKQPLRQGCFLGVAHWKMIGKCYAASLAVGLKRQPSKCVEEVLLEGFPHSFLFNVDYWVLNAHSFLRKKNCPNSLAFHTMHLDSFLQHLKILNCGRECNSVLENLLRTYREQDQTPAGHQKGTKELSERICLLNKEI